MSNQHIGDIVEDDTRTTLRKRLKGRAQFFGDTGQWAIIDGQHWLMGDRLTHGQAVKVHAIPTDLLRCPYRIVRIEYVLRAVRIIGATDQ